MTKKELKGLIHEAVEESIHNIVQKIIREEITTLASGMRLLIREELKYSDRSPVIHQQTQPTQQPVQEVSQKTTVNENTSVLEFRKDMLSRMMVDIPNSGGNNFDKTPPSTWTDKSQTNQYNSPISKLLNQTLHESAHKLRENVYD